jgi:hypothetical protein
MPLEVAHGRRHLRLIGLPLLSVDIRKAPGYESRLFHWAFQCLVLKIARVVEFAETARWYGGQMSNRFTSQSDDAFVSRLGTLNYIILGCEPTPESTHLHQYAQVKYKACMLAGRASTPLMMELLDVGLSNPITRQQPKLRQRRVLPIARSLRLELPLQPQHCSNYSRWLFAPFPL